MFDEMGQTLLILRLGCRTKVYGHADQHLILWTVIGTNGVAQAIGQSPVNDAGIRLEIRCLCIPRLRPLRARRCCKGVGRSAKDDRESKEEAKRIFHTLSVLPWTFGSCDLFVYKLLIYLPLRNRWLTISRTAPSLSSGIRPRRRATS